MRKEREGFDDVSPRPWIVSRRNECRFQVCHFCRMTFGERTYLSLNGIADGDVPGDRCRRIRLSPQRRPTSCAG